MENDFPLIEVNEEAAIGNFPSINEVFDSDFKTEQKNLKINKKLKILMLFLVSLLLVISFILLLKFVILKKDNDKDDSKIPVIIDVDEGGEDMIAYIVANNSRKYNILGITTISPKHYVEDVANIWLRFLEYMNFDAKVYKGENQPLYRKTEAQEFFHEYQIDFPLTNKTIEEQSATDFMVNTIKNYKKKVTLFLLGPKTNFAKALLKDKSIINNIEEIFIMGGTRNDGNIKYNRKAEYNIYMGADAKQI